MNDIKVLGMALFGIGGDLVIHFELGSKIIISVLTIIYLLLRIKDLRTKKENNE